MNLKQKLKNIFLKKIAQKTYKKNISNEKIEKILIIRDGGIGDAICVYPLIRELKKELPNVQIDIYASLNNYFMYKYVPYANNIYLKYKFRHWYKTWIDIYKMRKNEYDLVIDDTVIRLHRIFYTILIKPEFAIASNGSKKRYGFNRSELSFYYKTYESDYIEHIVKKRLQVLKLINFKNINEKMEFFLAEENHKISKYLNNLKQYKLIGLNTDSSHISRTLNEIQIITLCKKLEDDDIKVILFSLPNKYNYFKSLIKDNNLSNVELSFKTKTIYEAAQIVNGLDVLISPDTSFIHIASGLNIPTIGLYWKDPFKYIEWGPKSDKSYFITPKTDESHIKNIDLNEIRNKAFELLEN